MGNSAPGTWPPRIGFRNSGLRQLSLRRGLELLAGCGVQELEVCLEHPEIPPLAWPPERAPRLLALLDELDLDLGCVSYHGKRDDLDAKEHRTRALLRIAPQLGARVALIAPPLDPGACDDFVAMCRRLCSLAADLGLRLAVEPEPATAVPDVACMERLLQAVDHPALAVGLDLGHAFLTEGSAAVAVERLGPWIAHTHWDDMAGGRHLHLPPGAGEADLLPAARLLRNRGYHGSWTVDLFQLGEDPAALVRAGVQGLRAVLAAVELPE